MNIFQSFLVFLLLLLLGGCAKPLHPDNYVERISPTWLDANRFIVAYPSKSADQKIVDLTLLRSAEIALQNGFNYFIVVNSEDSIAQSSAPQTGAAAFSTEFLRPRGVAGSEEFHGLRIGPVVQHAACVSP